jgi:hypothetical protein
MLAVAIFLFYIAGVSVRSHQGIQILIQNKSGATLENVSVSLENKTPYLIGTMLPNQRENVFMLPDAKSSIQLDIKDSAGVRHTKIVAGYVEHGYCGGVHTQILSDLRIESRDKSFAEWNWQSWYGFL